MSQIPKITLSLTSIQHEELQSFLFPPDGNEAACILLCGRRAGEGRYRLMVREIHPIPYELCSERTQKRVTWPTDFVAPLLDLANEQELSVIKIHSHPNGYDKFSDIDDVGDQEILPMIEAWVDADIPHGSMVMLPDGRMFGRILWQDELIPLHCICVVGPDLLFWYHLQNFSPVEFTASHAQAFGQGTTDKLRRLSVAVIGCSGTGSIVIEQLVRLGVGKLILVDDDKVEERNLNRIINATAEDARLKRAKVEVLAKAIQSIGLGTKVKTFNKNLWEREVVKAVAECDVLFGCMDTHSGRFLLNRLATYYTLPYFDIGVRLEAIPTSDGPARIRHVCGTVHYLQPGQSSHISRGLISMEQVAAEELQHQDPTAYRRQVKEGYIRGVQENRPAVISVNMSLASQAVLDFLARIHPYRDYSNDEIASIECNLSGVDIYCDPESESCPQLKDKVGLGDNDPLLGLPALALFNLE